MTDYFCGQFLSEIRCESSRCNYRSRSFNNFFDISVSFSSEYSSKTETISNMVREFLKKEDITDGYCGSEKKNRTMSKQM